MHRKEDETKLTFVLTLALSDTGRDSQDLDRVNLLLSTFERFFDQRGLSDFLIVVPAKDKSRISSAIKDKFDSGRFNILDETTVCPEFVANPETFNPWPRPNKGWYRQQLIKLAVFEHVQTPFYMTLDADVLFVRSFDVKSLIKDGRAALNIQDEEDFGRLYREEIAKKSVVIRKARYQEVEPILQLRRPDRYSNRWYGETPVLLNKELVARLAKHLERTHQKPWRSVLLENLPWTEYALYFLFAEHTGWLEEVYREGDLDTVFRLSQSLWQPKDDYLEPRDLSSMMFESVFDEDKDGVAIVIQSYLGYSVNEISRKIEPFV